MHMSNVYRAIEWMFQYKRKEILEKLGKPIRIEPLALSRANDNLALSTNILAHNIFNYVVLRPDGRPTCGKEIYKDFELLYVEGIPHANEDAFERIQKLFPNVGNKTKVHHTADRLFITDAMKRVLDELIINRIKKVEVFNSLQIPCRQGIALYGIPGTGKTTIAGMLYHTFKEDKSVDFEILSSKKVAMPYFSFEKTLNEMQAMCKIVFLEDADSYACNRIEGQENPRVGELLNVLDGVEDFGNVFIIIATNHIDRIDSAILRRGRVDVQIEIPAINDKAIIPKIARKQHPNIIFDDNNLMEVVALPTTPADIIAILRDAAALSISDGGVNAEGNLVVKEEHFRKYSRLNDNEKERVGFGATN
jgi:SpoVK/Ycf46/Vps4 family AAA+-type ATPase